MPITPTAHHDPRHRLLAVLACPLCGERLRPTGQTVRCARHHTFDIARHGYVSLLTGNRRLTRADTAPMVQARTAFLQAGHYAPLARTLADHAATLCPPGGTVLDAGTGTGYYLAAVLDTLPAAAGLGLDISTPALRRAARAHHRAGAASWDLWQPLPVRTGSIDLVLNVFAPRNGPEFHRVLQPDGTLLVITPTPPTSDRTPAAPRPAVGRSRQARTPPPHLGRPLSPRPHRSTGVRHPADHPRHRQRGLHGPHRPPPPPRRTAQAYRLAGRAPDGDRVLPRVGVPTAITTANNAVGRNTPTSTS